ncbi:MAG: chemotaxis protein CheA [Alcanivoracaceae bacterium]|nr:chemotaxis protein CheA [Alcanivoracaceae bacterium]
MSDFHERMWPAFKAEAEEQLEALDMALVRLEKSADSEDLRTVFRQFHTLKSSAAMMGYSGMESLAHAAEDVLGEIRAQSLDMTSDLLSMLLEATDFIRSSIAQLEGGQGECAPTDLAQRLRQVMDGSTGHEHTPEADDAAEDTLAPLCDHIANALEQAPHSYGDSRWETVSNSAGNLGFRAATQLLEVLKESKEVNEASEATLITQLTMIFELAGRDIQPLLQVDPLRSELTEAFAKDVHRLCSTIPDQSGGIDQWTTFRSVIDPALWHTQLLGFRGAQLLLRHLGNLARHASLAKAADTSWHDDLVVSTQLLVDIAEQGYESADLRDYCNSLVISSAPTSKDAEQIAQRDGLLAGEIEIDTESLPDHGEELISCLTSLVQVTDSTTRFHTPEKGRAEKTSIRFRFVFDGDRNDLQRSLARPGFTPEIIWLDMHADTAEQRGTDEKVGRPSAHRSNVTAQSDTIRIRSRSVDAVAGQVGGLLMQRNRLQHLLSEYESSLDALTSAQRSQALPDFLAQPVAQLLNFASQVKDVDDRIGAQMHTLQEHALSLRVVPISTLFNRFHRSVRQIAKDHDKDIALHVRGEDIRIDRGLVDRLVEPLLHLLRNSIDHGIESASRRRESGKDAAGAITLGAEQSGSQVRIRLTDDGAGIDPDLIRKKAVQRGLRTENHVNALSDAEVLQLVFIPGFSTREQVTELSGRGVGMDAVKHVVEAVGGNIKLASKPGEGCTIDLYLPLSAAIQNVVMVQSNLSPFAIADRHVREIIDMRHLPLQTVGLQHYVVIRDKTVPVYVLERLLGLKNADSPLSRRQLVLLESEGHIMGILCPAVTGRQQLFIQDADSLVATLPFVSGTSLLGDGRVAIILDCETLFGVAQEGTRFLHRQEVNA